MPQSSIHAKIVSTLQGYWTQSVTAKQTTDLRHDSVIESYNGEMPQKIRDAKAIQTKTHLGWTARAVDAFTARLAPLLVPSDTGYFSLYDVSQKYQLSCSVMSSLMGYFMTTAEFTKLIDRVLDTLALEGAIGLMPRWSFKSGLNALPDLDITVVNPQDITVYPVTEPINRAVVMVRTYMTRQELLDMAQSDPSQSFDVQAIFDSPDDAEVFTRPSSSGARYRTNSSYQRLGVEVIDYYAPALRVEDTTYYHVRATVVSGKHLIRFISKDDQFADPNPGAIFACLNEYYVPNIGPIRVGVGLCDKALDLEMAAMTIHNLGIDSIKDTVRPPRTYDPNDPYWNAQRSGFAPGELVPSASTNPRHLLPIEGSNRAVPQAEEIISRLQYQYESAIGIPNFLSGTADTDDRRVSATAKRLEANGADTGLRKHGVNINARAIRPLTEAVYVMVQQRVNAELQAIHQQQMPIEQALQQSPFLAQAQALSGEFEGWIQSGQGIPDLPQVQLDLSTFEDAVQKVDQVNNVERVLQALAPLAAQSEEVGAMLFAQVDFQSLIRTYMSDLDLEKVLRPTVQATEQLKQTQQSQDEAQQKQEQLQELQVQIEQAKAQAEIEHVQAETDHVAAETQKIQAETAQTLHEIENPEPKNGSRSTSTKSPEKSGA